MDINQSSLSRSKLNKPGIARSATENKAISEVNKAKDSQPKPELSQGQLIKGQILDHRYNEVKVQLEPSKQIITAKLSGDVPIAIGQEAQFIVTEDGSERLVLKYLPTGPSPSDITIQKALTASGLAMSDRNRAIVEELLKHTMPVDRQTLQTLVRLSNTNRDASPLTLVLMYKNNIPMTSANIRQFEAYQNGTSRLLNDIHSITKGLSELPLNLTTRAAVPGSDSNMLTQALQTNDKLLDVLLGSHSLSGQKAASASNDLTSLWAQVKQGTMSLEEAVSLIKTDYPDIEHLLSQPNQMIPNVNIDMQASALPDILSSALKQISGANNDLKPLPNILNPQDLASLAELLRSTPSLIRIADQVVEGTITTRDLLTTLQYSLTQLEGPDAETILTSPQYRTLLENSFRDKWTITPEKLSDKAALQKLYDNLHEDMEQLSALSKLETQVKDEARLQEPIKNLQENLRFMQDLNEVYTYLQLPVQLKNQDIHSELYVFTKKKAMQNPEDLSVLLHLDMTNLGSMNIHIRMNRTNLHAKFYMEDADAQRLISEYMPSLTEALSKKGYQIHSEVTKAYEKIDFSNDFIEDQIVEGDVKRYSFDIRT